MREEIKRLALEAICDGRMIESAWTVSMLARLPDNVPPRELYALKFSFYQGVSFIIALMSSPPPGATEEESVEVAEMLMDKINEELALFVAGSKENIKPH